MTKEANNNDDNPSETGDAESTGKLPSCGPGCGCREPTGKGNTKIKIAICLVVVVAVVGILLFKTTSAKQNTVAIGTSGFSNPRAGERNRNKQFRTTRRKRRTDFGNCRLEFRGGQTGYCFSRYTE